MSDERTLDLLEAKIEELRHLNESDGIDLSKEIERLKAKLEGMRQAHYANLDDWERVKLARHPKRPYALDFLQTTFRDFYELHGDRIDGDDRAIVAGLARLGDRPVAVVGQQKGRTTDENRERFFGMPRPHGYRKALRVMRLAERFRLPVITLIDTPGAFPGVASEEGNIGGAIAESLLTMSRLRTPTIATVIGEGGSGGALAIGVADRVLMLENAIYTVISPESAAVILWKDKERMAEAAEALHLTAEHLHELGLIDGIVSEPLGGAHKDPERTAESLRQALVARLSELVSIDPDQLVADRYRRYRGVGRTRPQSPNGE